VAIYNCDECGEMFDDDYSPCVEHPNDSSLFCCEGCATELEEDPKDSQAWDMKESDYL
jgi:predicted nucleic acid-binding Zn ribbon protein